MPKITDPNKLAELQNSRLELANKIQSYHTENQSVWNAEHEAVWSQINADYDKVHNELEDHNKCVAEEATSQEAAAARAERLNQIAGHGERFNAANRSRILAGGGANLDEDFSGGRSFSAKITSGPCAGMTRDEVGGLALASWLGGSGPRNAREAEACRISGVNANGNEMVCNLLDTKSGRKVQNAVRNRGIDEQFMNQLSSNIGSTGAYTFGSTFVSALEVAMTSASGIMETADIIRTESGEEMSWPTMDDTSNEGVQIGENTEVSTVDPSFGLTRWYAHKFESGMIKVPRELIEDNAVGLEGRIPDLLGERLGRIINRKATTGTGASTMYGIVTAATNGKTAASATAITFDELIDLEHSINRAIRANRASLGYMFNDTVLKLVRKLKDGQSRYLWQAGANTGAPDTLNTYRYTINDHMSDPATGVKSVLFGRLSSYKLRLVRGIRVVRLNERFAEKDQVAFVAFVRGDGNLLNAGDNPVKCLTQA